MRFRLVPRDEGFYPLFNQFAEAIAASSVALQGLIRSLPGDVSLVDEVIRQEKRCDELTRIILKRLDESIVTPFDREDIVTLTDKLDDAVDDMRTAADMIRLHHVGAPIEGVQDIADLIVEASTKLVSLVQKLPKLRDLNSELEQIYALESKGDQIFRETIARLYSGRYEALDVLKWQDVVDKVEKSLNRIERASQIISTIAVKHA